jgi:hypothetical protein
MLACSSEGSVNDSRSTSSTSSSTSGTTAAGSGSAGSSTSATSGAGGGSVASSTGTGGDGTTGVGGAGTGGAGRDGGGSGGGPTDDGGIDPSKITLAAIGANQTVGLEWPRVNGATAYKLYWSTMAGVTPQSGTPVDVAGPTYVHRALTNGTAYHYVVSAVTAAGEGPPSMEATATPGGEWALEALGAGDFDDIATGSRVPRVPIAKRVHVLLLAEGYLQAELATFHDHAKHNLTNPTNDVDRWQKELFDLEPYSKLQEGFVVWYLPRASTTHTDGGMSAFGTDSDTAAAPLFSALDAMGSDAFLFPPAAGSRNYVASFLLFDPARGRAGVSGHTTSCTSPTDRNVRMGCAFGIGHAHEFTHAFANVRDEYLDSGNSSSSTSETQNVVATNKCDSLPWAHLLEGRGINTTAQLVGAFGRPMQGYHSELRCHMNGTHDNGTFYCAGESLNLRVDRFCNFCRELIAFRLLYRTEVIAAASEQTAFQTWKSTYRAPFFKRFGFSVPTPVPQTLTCSAGAKPVYEACMP